MKNDRRMIAYIIYIIFGAVLMVLGMLEVVDSFWSGMGGALIAVGVVRMIHILRYHNDESYRENLEIERKDERNQFIRSKAWAWAGYLFILISAVSVIILKVMGQELLSMACSFAVCLMLALYWISYYILQRKY